MLSFSSHALALAGALMFCFKKQPRIKYALSGGRALGGSAINTVVKPFINSIVKDQVSKGGGCKVVLHKGIVGVPDGLKGWGSGDRAL